MISMIRRWRRKRRVSRAFLDIAIALALLIGMAVGALISQRPIPAPSVSSQNQQNLSSQQGQNASSANQNTTTPTPTVIQQGNSVQGAQNPQEQRGPEHDKASGPWSLINAALMVSANVMMAFFTGLLYCITRRQAYLFAVQNRIMGQQSRLMSGQLQTAITAAETATKTLNMTHRPQLVVRHVVVKGIDNNGHIGDRLTGGYIWVTNTGVLPATLVKAHSEWLFAENLPLENPALHAMDYDTAPTSMPPASFVKVPIADRTIEANEYISINNAVKGIEPSFNESGGTLFLIGYLKYMDAIGLRRRYYCRKYDTDAHRFVEIDDPSYSYED